VKRAQQFLKFGLLGILCLLCFNFPILGIFNYEGLNWFGFPHLFGSIFILWGIFILMLIFFRKN